MLNKIGILLYEMCALRLPFEAKDMPALIRKIMSARYTQLGRKWNESMRRLIRLMLQKESRVSCVTHIWFCYILRSKVFVELKCDVFTACGVAPPKYNKNFGESPGPKVSPEKSWRDYAKEWDAGER